MIYIGVTGGIGSGKSLVCSIFKQLDIPIFFADEVANAIVADEKSIQSAIKKSFGDQIFDAEHNLKRKELAAIVFQDPEKLQQLNAIVHPAVFDRFDDWKKEVEGASKAPYALVEAALMFESGFYELMDYIVAVETDEKVRITRVMLRDSIDDAKVRERMRHQLSPEELREESDFIIQNNGSREDLHTKVKFFHAVFSTLKKRQEVQ
ncbi:MAG: dephospho-CoA kinase [Bacteroidota bacterium]